MKELYLFIIGLCFYNVIAQRVAPGVPPQQYAQNQQYNQHQQYQHQQQQQQFVQQQLPMQHQQVPVQQQQQQQFQQVPVQQVQYQQPQVPQVPIQQIPIQQQQHASHHHGHGVPQPGQILNAANMEHEKDHIAEHMDVPIDTSKMSEQELQFHYFKMHDADNNNKLDGCELIKSLIHWHEQGSKDHQSQVEDKIFKDDELVTLIDPILTMDDNNRDGYIDYPEFVRAQQKAAASAPKDPKTGFKERGSKTDEDLSGVIDPIFGILDANNDGFINYAEFKNKGE